MNLKASVLLRPVGHVYGVSSSPEHLCGRLPLSVYIRSVRESAPTHSRDSCALFFPGLRSMGVQFFSGAMPRCTDPSVTIETDCVGNFLLQGDLCAYLPSLEQELACKQNIDGVLFPRLWKTFPSSNSPPNYAGESFEDTPHSLLVVS